MEQLIATVELLNNRGIALESLTEKIETYSPQGKLVFHIFASLAEFERSLIRERVNAGLQAARQRGRKGGRPRVGEGKLSHASALLKAGYSTAKAARAIGRATLCRYRTAQKLATEALQCLSHEISTNGSASRGQGLLAQPSIGPGPTVLTKRERLTYTTY